MFFSNILCKQAEILDPAIEGTLNVLRSCKKNPSLRRVILTSSSSTVRVRDDFDPNIPLDETFWSSVELCERLQVTLFKFFGFIFHTKFAFLLRHI